MEKCVCDLGRGELPKSLSTSHLAVVCPNFSILEGSLGPAASVCPKAQQQHPWSEEWDPHSHRTGTLLVSVVCIRRSCVGVKFATLWFRCLIGTHGKVSPLPHQWETQHMRVSSTTSPSFLLSLFYVCQFHGSIYVVLEPYASQEAQCDESQPWPRSSRAVTCLSQRTMWVETQRAGTVKTLPSLSWLCPSMSYLPVHSLPQFFGLLNAGNKDKWNNVCNLEQWLTSKSVFYVSLY